MVRSPANSLRAPVPVFHAVGDLTPYICDAAALRRCKWYSSVRRHVLPSSRDFSPRQTNESLRTSLNDHLIETPSSALPSRMIRSPTTPPVNNLIAGETGSIQVIRHFPIFGSKNRTVVPRLRSPLLSLSIQVQMSWTA